MKIMEFLNPVAVSANIESTDKKEAIRELVDLLIAADEIKAKDKDKVIKVLLEREALGSTGIGQGIGIPHGKYPGVNKLIGACGISHKGVDFESLDGEKVYIFFLLLAPEDSAGPHLKALARVSRLLKDKYFRETLRAALDDKTLVKIIKQEDLKK
ncbi:MAG: PTS sugar transporter subunit IIA [Candidatus Omnitrophota bacterium]